MGRKKKKREPDYQPWCYYCDRKFVDETVLIQHQKARHFKCSTCHKKMTTAQGLSVHCSQVHKTVVEAVPHAKPGREDPSLEIFGMAGVPEGAQPGAPLPEDLEERDAKLARLDGSAAALPPALDPLGSMPPISHQYTGQPFPVQPHIQPPGYPMFPAYPPGGPFLPPHAATSHILPFQTPPFGAPGNMPPALTGPPSQPLFPINSEAQLATSMRPHGQQPFPLGSNVAAPQLFPIPAGGAASIESTSIAQAAANNRPSDARLIWTDAIISMEEKRATLPKYEKASSSTHGLWTVHDMAPASEQVS